MQQLIETMVQALVDEPERVVVRSIHVGHLTIFEAQVAKQDMGKVIGKGGQTILAIRKILDAAGSRRGEFLQFEVTDGQRTGSPIHMEKA